MVWGKWAGTIFLSLMMIGKRDLTQKNIGALSKCFGVDPVSFVSPV